ncbi:buddy of Hmr 1 isoform 2-T2 [Cochliomyia hominivorax]
MITNKNSRDLILLNCHELPETVCVETRFITQAAAKQKKNEPIFYLTTKNVKPATVTLNIQSKPVAGTVTLVPQNQQQTAGTKVPQATTLSNNNIITSNINQSPVIPVGNITDINTSGFISLIGGSQIPSTYSMMTTVVPVASNTLNLATDQQLPQSSIVATNMNSIGIQCKLDEELEEWEFEFTPLVEQGSTDNQETDKEHFLKFIQEHSTQHKNFRECLICGEICKSEKYFYGHMEIHRGSRVLCFECGKYLESAQLLSQHNCRKAERLENAFLHCPFYNCRVVAISRLELYDHINEHSNDRMYKCSGCNRGFCTGQEFLRHLLIRAKCYTSARRKRFRVYGLEFPKDRLCRVRVFTLHTFKKRTTLVKSFLSQRVPKRGVCKICLKSFTNNSVYNRHREKCVAKFRKKLVRKRNKAINR